MKNTKKKRTAGILFLMILFLLAVPTTVSAEISVSKGTLIQLNKTKKSVTKGKRFKLKATLCPAPGQDTGLTMSPMAGTASGIMPAAEPEPTSAGTKILWKSSDSNVARVNAKGRVTAAGAGTAEITAYTEDGSAAEAVCTVTVKLSPIQLSATQTNLVVGKKMKLSITSDKGNAVYQWSSSNKAVAKVNKSGKVKGKKAGVAVITVRCVEDGRTASCTVTVMSEETMQTLTQPSAYATQLLAIMQKYSNQVKADKEAGVRWVYSNNAQFTWADACKEARKKKVTHMNCALGCRWALREMGLLDITNNFWGVYGGGVEFRSKSKEQLLEHCVILPVYKTPDELLAEGNLLPGDICTYVSIGHTNVYAGDGLWYECGRCGLNGKYEGKDYVFDSFGPVASVNMSGTKIGTIIRIVK